MLHMNLKDIIDDDDDQVYKIFACVKMQQQWKTQPFFGTQSITVNSMDWKALGLKD